MPRCDDCAGRLWRVHRTFLEHFVYEAIFRCRVCQKEKFIARPYVFRLGKECRCPRCGTYRVVQLKKRDRIDPMDPGLLSLWQRLVIGGNLFHCNLCRIQFYDRRPLAPEQATTPELETRRLRKL